MSNMNDSRYTQATVLLRQRLGCSVSVDGRDLFEKSFDGMKIAFKADAVVRPQEESEVGILLQLANQHRVPVT
ncbi:MAG: FAD-binding oxidoreductase, partial [Opitutae bacterium]|nr:FAD-binding oxidoreductase [Opitutae bacterium]